MVFSDAPFYFWIICGFVAALSGFLLYLRNRSNTLGKKLRILLFILRFLAVFLVAVLLLSPLIQSTKKHVKEPVVILLLDNSQSIGYAKDSLFYKTIYLDMLQRFSEDMEKEYLFRSYLFEGSNSEMTGKTNGKADFSGKITNIAGAIEEVHKQYEGENIGAVIIATDGIYNQGRNPLYLPQNIDFPVYTIAMGDTIKRRDLVIQNVLHNRISFLNNTFPVEVLISAEKCEDEKSRITISTSNGKQKTEDFFIKNSHYFQKFYFEFSSDKEGIMPIDIKLETIKDEVNTDNNFKRIYVEILDNKQKILVVSSAPHPDISALKQTLAENMNYEVEYRSIRDKIPEINDYNLIILFEVPGYDNGSINFYSKVIKSGIPVLHLMGSRTNVLLIRNQNIGIGVDDIIRNQQSDAYPVFNDDFVDFRVKEEMKTLFNSLTPLHSPFARYTAFQNGSVLLFQKIAQITTEQPLIMFYKKQKTRYGFIVGEGLWRWKMKDFLQHQSHDNFNQLIYQMIQYLSVREDKSRFRIFVQSSYAENEPILINAEVYNEAYEPITDPNIDISIFNEAGSEFKYAFNKKDRIYQLNAGNLPVGSYSYIAKVDVGNKKLEKKGVFVVRQINIESIDLLARHQLLFALAGNHGGEMFYPDEWDDLANAIKSNEQITSVSYQENSFITFINMPWLLFFIVLLFATEWLVRKRSGTY